MSWYALTVKPDDNDTILVTAPAFPEVTTFGETADDALAQGRRAIEEAIAARMARNEAIPLPRAGNPKEVSIEVPALLHLKVSLYRLCRERGVSRAELARRLGWHREQVDRLFRLGHHSRIDQIEAAFEAVGGRLRIDVAKVA